MLRRATPVLHGYAVAWGLVCELFMASTKLDFPTEHLYAVTRYVTTHYGRPEITCDDYDELRELMLHDKKNTAGGGQFHAIGRGRQNHTRSNCRCLPDQRSI